MQKTDWHSTSLIMIIGYFIAFILFIVGRYVILKYVKLEETTFIDFSRIGYDLSVTFLVMIGIVILLVSYTFFGPLGIVLGPAIIIFIGAFISDKYEAIHPEKYRMIDTYVQEHFIDIGLILCIIYLAINIIIFIVTGIFNKKRIENNI